MCVQDISHSRAWCPALPAPRAGARTYARTDAREHAHTSTRAITKTSARAHERTAAGIATGPQTPNLQHAHASRYARAGGPRPRVQDEDLPTRSEHRILTAGATNGPMASNGY